MKKFLILIPFLFLIGCSTTPTATTPTGCMSGNCFDGYGTFHYDNGRYVGEFKNSKFDGQGTYTWAGGNKYVGEWKNNLANGQGTFTWADGTTESGIWKNGWDLIVDDLKEEEKLDTMLAKQETCKTLGFKIGTEKNGDCVLKLMELETKVAQSTQTINNNNSDNATAEALAKIERRLLIQQQSQALINMGSALLNSGKKPSINCRKTFTGWTCN